MVRALLILILLTCVIFSAHAAPQFRVAASATSVELGKSIDLHFHTNSASTLLSKIDLSPLQNYFYINSENDSEINTHGKTQDWSIQLYPLKTGTYAIPPLLFNNIYSNPVTVTVTQAIDPRTNMPFDVAHNLSTNSPWQRQQVVLTTTVITDNKFALLETKKTQIKNTDIYPVTLDKRKVNDTTTSYTLGWVVLPLLSGKQAIPAFEFQYTHQGKVTHRFYTPPHFINVKPLPLYVPPTIPVGKLAIKLTGDISRLNINKSLTYWHVSLRGSGMPSQYIPTLDSQLNSTHNLAIYPASPVAKQSILPSGINSALTYSIPYKFTRQGINALPDLKLNYFDPNTGKLAVTQLAMSPAYVVNTFILLLGLIFVAISIMYLVYRIYLVLRGQYLYVTDYLHALSLLKSAQTCYEIKQALVSIRPKQLCSNTNNISLQNWQQIWHHYYNERPEFINDLSQAIYHGKQFDMKILLNETLECVTKTWWQQCYLWLYTKRGASVNKQPGRM